MRTSIPKIGNVRLKSTAPGFDVQQGLPGLPYDAAGTGRRSMSFGRTNTGPNVGEGTARTLRTRGRHEGRNNPHAKSIKDTITANAVGVGIKPKSRCPDEAARKEIDALFKKWVRVADFDGTCDFYGLQRLVMDSVVESGEVFPRHRAMRVSDGLVVPYQVQLMEADQVTWKDDGDNLVRSGIEFDYRGKRVYYHVYREHPEDAYKRSSGRGMEVIRLRAENVMHCYLPLRPGQLRGISWLAPILTRLKEIDEYDDAELVRKKTAALFAGFIKTADEGQGADRDPVSGEEADDDGVALATLEPGTMQVLKPDQEVVFSTPSDVGGMFYEFMRYQLRCVAAAVGVTYEQLTGDLSDVNDRTIRASLTEVRRRFQMWQFHILVFQFCEPVWRRFLELAELAGAISRPAGMDDDDFMAVEWMPQGWDYLNPLQDAQADELRVKAGFTSRRRVLAESGDDVEDVDAEIAADRDRAKSLDLAFTTDPTGGAALAPLGADGKPIDPRELTPEPGEDEGDGEEGGEPPSGNSQRGRRPPPGQQQGAR